MDLLEQTFEKKVEHYYLLSRQRCLPSEQNTYDNIHLSQKIHNIIGDAFSPHTIYHFAVVINDMLWFDVNSYIINSEEYSEEKKVHMLSEDSEYRDEKFECWSHYSNLSRKQLINILCKFTMDQSMEWDVNSAARGVIDNLLIATWNYRDCLMRD